MNFKEALEILGIERYAERIIDSNSKGELFHISDYIMLAEGIGKTTWFSAWFDCVVKEAKTKWDRPESVFQHIPKLFGQFLMQVRDERSN